MSELHLYVVRERKFWTDSDMMSVMREIEDYVLDRPIAKTSAYDKLVEKFQAALLALQHYHHQLVEVYQPQIVQLEVSEGESPKSPSDSADSEAARHRRSWCPAHRDWPAHRDLLVNCHGATPAVTVPAHCRARQGIPMIPEQA